MKKVFIKTYGCQMNERDSEAVAAMLRARGYAIAETEADADAILLNTCSVRDLAEQKALGKMSTLAHLKRSKPELVLGFMGCMAQSRGAELLKDLPGVDLVIGTQRFHHVPDYLDQVYAGRDDLTMPFRVADVADESGSESSIKDHDAGSSPTAFVSIMQGCDMYCSFCIVPYTRGRERSRPIPEIVEEVRQLVAAGAREVTLLGQIVTSYGRNSIPKKAGKSAFVQLLEAVHEVPGLERIRLTSPHPKGFGGDLVAAYRDLPKLCEHAHLPVQSGSNRLLKLMNRGYSREWFLKILEKLRAAQSKIELSTDIIVGFPGETAADFEETVALMREVVFDQAYIFKYSTRRDTPAAVLPDQVSTAVKEERNQTLLEILNAGILRKNQQLVGQTVEVLVEGQSLRQAHRMFGRTRTNKGVVFEGGTQRRGQLLPIKIERATTVTLYGEPQI
jgi:tRNA-2-methylthio-N6-dimethylallyladenosine synthase